AGGDVEDPSYEEVCTGETGHAEAVQVEFDPSEVSYRELLDIFFDIHDPTTQDREGPDVGSQYRSAVFYHGEKQKDAVEEKIEALEAEGMDVVTEVEPLDTFYEAEEAHQDYFEKHPDDAYCRMHVAPKVEKVRD
ncbi:MAG: peptide-methionine (S)-S-oxide reductase MsrA, partial [Candidatus Nanohaloarchaea archaeon]|nr:peptide-methionine (S)-S-oxide reductase MsrA [Candidatus Nanohaloarchaea archaeon]